MHIRFAASCTDNIELCVATTNGWSETANHYRRRTRRVRAKRRPVRTVHGTGVSGGVELPSKHRSEQTGRPRVRRRPRLEEGERQRESLLATVREEYRRVTGVRRDTGETALRFVYWHTGCGVQTKRKIECRRAKNQDPTRTNTPHDAPAHR